MGVVAIFLLPTKGCCRGRHARIDVVGSIFFDTNEVVLVAIGGGLSSRETRIVLWVSAVDGAIFAKFERVIITSPRGFKATVRDERRWSRWDMAISPPSPGTLS